MGFEPAGLVLAALATPLPTSFGDILAAAPAPARAAASAATSIAAPICATNTEITLEEARTAAKRPSASRRWKPQTLCHGSGAKPGTEPKTCSKPAAATAKGGMQQGFFSIQQPVRSATAPASHYRTHAISATAARPGERTNLNVKIPAGIDEGTASRLATCQRGSGWATVCRDPYPRTQVFHATVMTQYCEMPHLHHGWAGKSKIPTWTAAASRSQAETQSGQRLRGNRHHSAAPASGDQFCHGAGKPQKLTERQKNCRASLKPKAPTATTHKPFGGQAGRTFN